jgi:hypothetical protein
MLYSIFSAVDSISSQAFFGLIDTYKESNYTMHCECLQRRRRLLMLSFIVDRSLKLIVLAYLGPMVGVGKRSVLFPIRKEVKTRHNMTNLAGESP